MASRYQYVNGVVDYAEAAVGRRYAYYVGWFLAVLYYPTLTSVLAWVSARKRFVLPGLSVACCLFMMTAACFSHRMAVVYYLAVFAAVMAPGAFFAPRHKQ